MLSRPDQKRIAEAVSAAEEGTSGEISCVLVQEVSNYREVPLAWAALAALAAPPLLVLAGLGRLTGLFSGWTDGSLAGAEALVPQILSTYVLLQAAIFLAVAVLFSQPRLRRLVTPAPLKRHRVRQVARHHFVASGARLGQGVPHILIFASLHDRRVELVAHDAVHQAVGQGVWDEAVAAVREGMRSGRPTEGFVRAIGLCGAAMARHFPATGPKENRLPNEIVER